MGELSQTKRDGGCGTTDYLVVVRHIPTGVCCEHEYCCYHPMAGPIRPDPVTNLTVEEVNSSLIVKWEWSENSFDLASPGAIFRRSISLHGSKLAWAGPCRSEKKVRPKKVVPPPAVPLTLAEEVLAADLTYNTGGEHLLIKHAPSGSVAEYEGPAEFNSYQNVKLYQAGGFVRVEFLMRCSENGDKFARDVTRFVKLNNGGLDWA